MKFSCRLTETLEDLRKNCEKFDEISYQIDLSVPSPFVQGDERHKPIFFFIELVSDLLHYFYTLQCKFNCASDLIEIENDTATEGYRNLLKTLPPEDFKDYFQTGLSYCKCQKSELNKLNYNTN